MARSVKPSTGRLAKQFPRSRRSLTHSRGGKRSSSLLGGVQSWYTACRTSLSKDRTSFSSASESPYLWGGRKGNTPGSPAFGRCRHRGRERCSQLHSVLHVTKGFTLRIWTMLMPSKNQRPVLAIPIMQDPSFCTHAATEPRTTPSPTSDNSGSIERERRGSLGK